MRTAPWLALALLATACLPPRQPADIVASSAPPAAGSPAGDPAEAPTGSPSTDGERPGTPTTPAVAPPGTPDAPATSDPPADVLEDRYREDADGNAIPDFVEEQLGLDPAVDDCLAALDCPGISTVADVAVERNVLLILDSSGSMAAPDASGVPKLDAAREAITRYVVATPDGQRLGLMVYGHVGSNSEADRPASCAGIELFAPLGELRTDTVDGVLAQFAPTGWTPIAASLLAAADGFPSAEGGADNRVVLVTDGLETCDGDPVAAAAALYEADIAVTVDVVGFDVPDADAQALRAIAEVTGGTYSAAGTGAELQAFFDDLTAQQHEIVERLGCIANAQAEQARCAMDTAQRAVAVLNEEIDELAGAAAGSEDTARRFALETLRSTVLGRSQEAINAYGPQLRAQVEELQRQLEAARQRFRERFGEEIAAVAICPDDASGALA